MRQGMVDHDIVDTLAVAFGGKNLRVEHQPPKIRVHGFFLVSRSLPFRLDRVGIRHADLKTGTAGQEKKTYAGSGAPGAKFLPCAGLSLACGSHYRSPYRIVCGAFGLEGLVVVV